MKEPTELQKWVEDRLEVLDILKKNWSTTASNGSYHRIAFNIWDDEDFKKVDKWLNPLQYEVAIRGGQRMNDKEFEELKRKVAEEERRRNKLAQQKEYLESLKNGLGLKKPDGWVNTMEIKITQKVNMSTGNDGNGPSENRYYEVKLNENECELLFEAFEQMASLYEKNINSLEHEEENDK